MSISLLSKLMAGTKNYIDIPFPGNTTKIRLRLLSNQDTLDSTFAADQLFAASKIVVSAQNINAYENEKTVQMLFRSCVDLETGKPIAEDVHQFRLLTTNEIRAALIVEYNALADECDPSPLTMDGAKYDQLLEALKKNPSQTIGNISSFRMLKKLTCSLIEELQSLQKDNGHTSS